MGFSGDIKFKQSERKEPRRRLSVEKYESELSRDKASYSYRTKGVIIPWVERKAGR